MGDEYSGFDRWLSYRYLADCMLIGHGFSPVEAQVFSDHREKLPLVPTGAHNQT